MTMMERCLQASYEIPEHVLGVFSEEEFEELSKSILKKTEESFNGYLSGAYQAKMKEMEKIDDGQLVMF